MNYLPGWDGVASIAAKAMPDLTFLQATEDATNTTVYTFSSQNLGAARSDRLIIATVFFVGNGADRTLSSATIGGVAATIVVQVTDTGPVNGCTAAIIQAAVPTGTSGDVVITPSGSCLKCGIGLYRATGLLSTTAGSTSSDTEDALGFTLSVSDDGIAVSGAIWDGTANVLTTDNQTKITEDFDQVFDVGSHIAGASSRNLTASATYAVGLDGDAGDAAGVAAAWR